MTRRLCCTAILLALFTFDALAQQCGVDCMCPELDPARHADQIKEKLSAGQHAVLCPNTVWRLRNTIYFSPYYPNTYLLTWGQPRDNSRAHLYADTPDDQYTHQPLVRLIHGSAWDQNGQIACHFCQIRNIIVDGSRDAFGRYNNGSAMVTMGGPSDGQIIDSVTFSNPRNAACLAIEAGVGPGCRNVQVTNSWFGPAGFMDGSGEAGVGFPWSDGIQLQCRDSVVFYNEITDTTDGGIAIFGAAGSDVHHNRITAIYREAHNGIIMGDQGDYTNTRVHDNIINGQSAYIRNGLPQGPHTGGCTTAYNSGGSVYNNSFQGYMGYAMSIDGVTNWSVYGNTFSTYHYGIPATSCQTGQQLPSARKCAYNVNHSSGFFQYPCTAVQSMDGASGIRPY
jgi:hypothetical protein